MSDTIQSQTINISIDTSSTEGKELLDKVQTLCEDYKETQGVESSVKATVEFDLEDDYGKHLFNIMSNAENVYEALIRMRNEIFRPIRKHGYNDSNLNKLIEHCGGHDTLEISDITKYFTKTELDANPNKYFCNAESLVGILEAKFSQILIDAGVNPSDIY